MDILREYRDGVLVLRISGRVDSASAPQLGNALDNAIDAGHKHIILDLSSVPYMSSAGLRVLTMALKAVRSPKVGGDLALTGLSRNVTHAFRISGFSQVFHIFDSLPEAVAAMDVSEGPKTE